MKPRTHNYSNQTGMGCGGKVKGYADGGQVSKKTTKKKTSQLRTDRSGNVQSSSVGSTTDTLRNRRAEQMRALGLKDGGRVNPLPPPKKGPKPKKITTPNPPGGRRPQAR